MNLFLNVWCFNCGRKGNHYHVPITFKGEGFYSCDPVAEEHK